MLESADSDAHTFIKASPKWSGPYEPVAGAELFQSAPFKPREIAVHVAGGTLNATACGIALEALLRNPCDVGRNWISAALSVAAATYLADLTSGILHWAFDTWFDENNESVARMVRIVREHHVYPQKIFIYSVHQEIGLMSWFGLVGVGPACLYYMIRSRGTSSARVAGLAAGLVYSLLVTFSLEFHKIGHRFERGRVIRTLQKAHLILSPEHHMKHHAREHDNYYCIVNGVGDLTAGRLGFFRLLERGVTALSGQEPRENDRRWRRRFGRWVSPES